MRIIIVGCGKVGFNLAEQLLKENHALVIIDEDPEVIRRVEDKLDALAYKGHGESIYMLKRANAAEADLLIAVTMSDELNMICCLLAKRLGCRYTVARIRNPEYNREWDVLQKEIGLNLVINPEQNAAREIAKLLRAPSATSFESFARGRVDLIGIRLNDTDCVINKPISTLGSKIPKRVLLCAIERDGAVFIPNGSSVMKGGDIVYTMGDHANIGNFFKMLGRNMSRVKNIIIAGGGRIAIYLTWILRESGIHIKIIEKNAEKCLELSDLLQESKVLVIHADATEQEMLDNEDLSKMDAFIAITDRDEENLLSSLYAKQCEVPHVITKMNRPNYKRIINQLGIDSVIVPKDLTANSILRYVRSVSNIGGGSVEALYKIAGGLAEAAEFTATESTEFLDIPLSNVNLKEDTIIGMIVRKGEVIIPHGADCVMLGDKVIAMVCNRVVNDLNDLLEV